MTAAPEAPSQRPILTARGLVKRYGRVIALDEADFDLYPNEILAVIGDNGAGKTSLIKALTGAVRIGARVEAGVEAVMQRAFAAIDRARRPR